VHLIFLLQGKQKEGVQKQVAGDSIRANAGGRKRMLDKTA
jgi:hypothetical protein